MSVIDTCKRQFKSLFGGKSETNVKHQQQQEYQANMTGTAVAKVNGVVVAETDDYETVEGNIYVRFLFSFFLLSFKASPPYNFCSTVLPLQPFFQNRSFFCQELLNFTLKCIIVI